MANPVTGVVTRKDPVTGGVVPANIRPTSGEDPKAKPVEAVPQASLSSGAMAAVLGFQK